MKFLNQKPKGKFKQALKTAVFTTFFLAYSAFSQQRQTFQISAWSLPALKEDKSVVSLQLVPGSKNSLKGRYSPKKEMRDFPVYERDEFGNKTKKIIRWTPIDINAVSHISAPNFSKKMGISKIGKDAELLKLESNEKNFPIWLAIIPDSDKLAAFSNMYKRAGSLTMDGDCSIIQLPAKASGCGVIRSSSFISFVHGNDYVVVLSDGTVYSSLEQQGILAGKPAAISIEELNSRRMLKIGAEEKKFILLPDSLNNDSFELGSMLGSSATLGFAGQSASNIIFPEGKSFIGSIAPIHPDYYFATPYALNILMGDGTTNTLEFPKPFNPPSGSAFRLFASRQEYNGVEALKLTSDSGECAIYWPSASILTSDPGLQIGIQPGGSALYSNAIDGIILRVSKDGDVRSIYSCPSGDFSNFKAEYVRLSEKFASPSPDYEVSASRLKNDEIIQISYVSNNNEKRIWHWLASGRATNDLGSLVHVGREGNPVFYEPSKVTSTQDNLDSLYEMTGERVDNRHISGVSFFSFHADITNKDYEVAALSYTKGGKPGTDWVWLDDKKITTSLGAYAGQSADDSSLVFVNWGKVNIVAADYSLKSYTLGEIAPEVGALDKFYANLYYSYKFEKGESIPCAYLRLIHDPDNPKSRGEDGKWKFDKHVILNDYPMRKK